MLESGLPKMERASRVIATLNPLRESCDSNDIVCAAWKRAVGKKVASHTRASKLVRQTLVVEVGDWLWQRNLNGLSRQILKNLEKHIGPGIVTDVEFRILPARRGPQLAAASLPVFELESKDEADRIADPGLRRIYRRKRNSDNRKQEIA